MLQLGDKGGEEPGTPSYRGRNSGAAFGDSPRSNSLYLGVRMKLFGWAIALAAVLATPAAAQSTTNQAAPTAAASTAPAATGNAMAAAATGTGGPAQAATKPFQYDAPTQGI